MGLSTILAGIRRSSEIEAERRDEVTATAARAATLDYLARLPAARQAEIIAAAIPSSSMTEQLLRRFVAACPSDKTVEVTFPGGGRVVIGPKSAKVGPGW